MNYNKLNLKQSQKPPHILTDDLDKLLAILCHVSFFIGFPFILPLIIFLVYRKNREKGCGFHACDALNFHISLVLISIIFFIGYFILSSAFSSFFVTDYSFSIGFILWIIFSIALSIFTITMSIVSSVKASNNKFFLYPLTLRIIQ